jgi:integrase
MRPITRRATAPVVMPAAMPTPTEAEIWANLRDYAEQARGAFAGNTERALRSDIGVFTDWCGQEGLRAMPAAPETVCRFVDAMAASRQPSTVRRYVASLAAFHRAAKVPNPCEALSVKLALRRMHNAKGWAQRQASALNEGAIRRLLDVGGSRLINLRNRALLVVGYVTMCRRGELVALRFADLTVEPDGFGTVLVRRGKTDQEGHGAVVPIPADAMRHLMKWISAARITDGALFRAVRHHGSGVGGPLDPADVARIFKAMARAARLPADLSPRISGHSVRIGAAQDALRYKESLAAIMQAGRWKSPEMVGRYVKEVAARDSAANRIAAAREPFG